MPDETRKNSFDPSNKLHVISVSGRQFITFAGLQARLADQGKSIVDSDFDILQWPKEENAYETVVKAILQISDRNGKSYTFRAIGDASPESVGAMIKPHMKRMAETRGQARALRIATRSEFTSIEEINQ